MFGGHKGIIEYCGSGYIGMAGATVLNLSNTLCHRVHQAAVKIFHFTQECAGIHHENGFTRLLKTEYALPVFSLPFQ